jgi:transcriptional regulator with XRE-family HTH domain
MGLGERIKEARVQILGLTQRELARALDVEQVNVSRWEREAATPRPENLRAIAKLAKKPIAWFYEERQAA